jgi:hypothetical protein
MTPHRYTCPGAVQERAPDSFRPVRQFLCELVASTTLGWWAKPDSESGSENGG